ncbi:LysR family transcriptional regulator [Rhodobacteraceae bacterium NNCM2]|nr:LysR family transcriptional regulator [Coraliihabitans acroporae]
MNLRQLEAFRAVFRAGSVSGGAALLHTSQPSLSRLIADLEASVGFALFTRGRRGMVPTVEGRLFHEAVESSFVGIDRLKDTARAIAEVKDGGLSIGVIPSVAQTLLPPVIARLRDERPGQKTGITVANASVITKSVLLNEVHVGVVSTAFTLEGVEVLFETAFEGICLVPQDHDLARSQAPIDLRELPPGGFVSYDRPLLEAMKLGADIVDDLISKATVTSHSMPTLVALARATSQLAVVDRLAAEMTSPDDGMVAREILQKTTHGLAVIKRPDQPLPRPAAEFVAATRAVASGLFGG